MPLGLEIVPVALQRALNVILALRKWQTAIVYLNDVIVFLKDAEQHIRQVDRVLRLMSEGRMSLKLQKCFVLFYNIDYQRHVLLSNKLKVSSKTKKAIKSLSYPTDVYAIRSFLDLCNVYRRLVTSVRKQASPQSQNLNKSGPTRFELDDFGYEAYDSLKRKLPSIPVLALHQATGQLPLDVNVCDY